MDAVVEHSRDSIAKGSKSFRAAARLFTPATREDAWLLYAWCRYCDDEIDGQDHGHGAVRLPRAERKRRLERLRRLTRAALAGEPVDDPTFAAFQRVARRHAFPERWPMEMLDGFAMDVDEARFEAVDDVLLYCWGVAGVVGVMMALVMGVRDLPVLRRAQDLGLAFQLTNIARDVIEDAGTGRVYLPEQWLREAGVEPRPAAVAHPANRQAVHAVSARLLELAEPYYDSARGGLRDLPFRSSLAIAAARGVYREIGRDVLRRGPRAWDRRVIVGRPRKAYLFGRGLLIALYTQALDRGHEPPERGELWSRI